MNNYVDFKATRQGNISDHFRCYDGIKRIACGFNFTISLIKIGAFTTY